MYFTCTCTCKHVRYPSWTRTGNRPDHSQRHSMHDTHSTISGLSPHHTYTSWYAQGRLCTHANGYCGSLHALTCPRQPIALRVVSLKSGANAASIKHVLPAIDAASRRRRRAPGHRTHAAEHRHRPAHPRQDPPFLAPPDIARPARTPVNSNPAQRVRRFPLCPQACAAPAPVSACAPRAFEGSAYAPRAFEGSCSTASFCPVSGSRWPGRWCSWQEAALGAP